MQENYIFLTCILISYQPQKSRIGPALILFLSSTGLGTEPQYSKVIEIPPSLTVVQAL